MTAVLGATAKPSAVGGRDPHRRAALRSPHSSHARQVPPAMPVTTPAGSRAEPARRLGGQVGRGDQEGARLSGGQDVRARRPRDPAGEARGRHRHEQDGSSRRLRRGGESRARAGGTAYVVDKSGAGAAEDTVTRIRAAR
jgi:hypothetical protein